MLWQTHDKNSNARVATISNLEPNKTYTICVLAYSSKGEGPVSDLIQVMMRQGGMYPVGPGIKRCPSFNFGCYSFQFIFVFFQTMIVLSRMCSTECFRN